jgi:hypothetical protein
MKSGQPPIGDDGYPMELHHPNGSSSEPPLPMTRTDHRLGENYLLNHPWLRSGLSMIDIFCDSTNSSGTIAGVFEADDETSFFYLYQIKPINRIIGVIRLCSRTPDFTESDVDIQWRDNDSKVGLLIRDMLWAVFDVPSERGRVGRYPLEPLNWSEQPQPPH